MNRKRSSRAITDREVFAEAIRLRAAITGDEILLPDPVFMRLSSLSGTWAGTFAGNYMQRLTVAEFDYIFAAAEKAMTAIIYAVLSQ